MSGFSRNGPAYLRMQRIRPPTSTPVFVEILAALAPLDAVVLDETYKRLLSEMKTKGNFQIVFLDSKAMQQVLVKAFENGAETSLENLIRLRVVETAPEWVDESGVRSRPVHRYYITKLGHDFYLACQPPETRESLRGDAAFAGLRQPGEISPFRLSVACPTIGVYRRGPNRRTR